MAGRVRVIIPQEVIDNSPSRTPGEPDGSRYTETQAHLVNPYCNMGKGCDLDGCKDRDRVACSLSGGGSRYGEIGGTWAAIAEAGLLIVTTSGCSAGSIITSLAVSGAALGIPCDEMLQALEDVLNEPLSPWPWVRKKQRFQKEKLREWIEEYWALAAVDWNKEGRHRNLMAHVIRLCAPCNGKWSWFSPNWEDPWTVTLFIKTILFGGVNDNQKVFANVAKLFPEKWYRGKGWLANASALMVDAWNTHPYQAILDGDGEFYDHLGPHYEDWEDPDTGLPVLSPGKNPACAGITYCDPDHSTLNIVASSCAIPALMKFPVWTKNPNYCLIYRDRDAALDIGYPPPGDPIETGFLDGGLWQTMPLFQAELSPTSHFNEPGVEDGIATNISVFSPYMTTNVYSHQGGNDWLQRYYMGSFNERPGFFGRWIGARIGAVIGTMYNCATWDQVMDQERYKESGGKATVTCTDFKEAREILLADHKWGLDSYPEDLQENAKKWVDHSEIADMPDSRTMKDGWTDKLMVTDVYLGYLSAKKQGLV